MMKYLVFLIVLVSAVELYSIAGSGVGGGALPPIKTSGSGGGGGMLPPVNVDMYC